MHRSPAASYLPHKAPPHRLAVERPLLRGHCHHEKRARYNRPNLHRTVSSHRGFLSDGMLSRLGSPKTLLLAFRAKRPPLHIWQQMCDPTRPSTPLCDPHSEPFPVRMHWDPVGWRPVPDGLVYLLRRLEMRVSSIVTHHPSTLPSKCPTCK